MNVMKVGAVLTALAAACDLIESNQRIIDHHLGHPCLRGEYKTCAIKQYVREHNLLRIAGARSAASRKITFSSEVFLPPECGCGRSGLSRP